MNKRSLIYCYLTLFKNFDEITTEANLLANIEKAFKFFNKNNGSKNFNDLRKENKYNEIDILDFWKKLDTWDNIKFEPEDPLKYAFCFLKFTSGCTVNFKELEIYYGKIPANSKVQKTKEMRNMLKAVRNNLLKMKSDADKNKGDLSGEIEYKVAVDSKGNKIVQGSVSELVYQLTREITKDKEKVKKAFKTYETDGEVDEKGFVKGIKDLGITCTKDQANKFFITADSDRDHLLAFEEIERFCFTYGEKIDPNLIKGKNKMQMFKRTTLMKEVLDIKRELVEDDYFKPESHYTTILNSDVAAILRVEQIINEMRNNGEKMYVDLEFGPKPPNKNGGKPDDKGNKMALYCTGEAPPGYIKPEQIAWYYPKEMTSKPCAFTSGDASSNEVMQGAVGDCWFIGGLSVIAAREELLVGGINQYDITDDMEITPLIIKKMAEGVYPPIFRHYEKYGIYVFRFFKNFDWRYVIIDARIPCYKANKQPVFARCLNISELWVPLIEKAYAKLHCCFESLVSGFIDDGLTDMTGFVAEKLNLHDKDGVFPNKKLGTEDSFWDYLKARREESSMLGCSRADETVEGQVIIDGEPTGILSRHAYGLLDVFEIVGENDGITYRLLRIRNPWGKTEWVGDWSDSSEQIQTYKKELTDYISKLGDDEKFELGAEDGTFLIEYKDWSTIYNKLYVTIDFPDTWTGIRFNDSWDESCAGGLPMKSANMTPAQAMKSWAKNPQYLIKHECDEDIEFFFSLAQVDGRLKRLSKFPFAEQIHPVCLIIYPSKDGKKVTEFDGKAVKPEFVSAVIEHKEVSLRAKLPKGYYIIVPGTREPNCFGEYYLSIYYDKEPLAVSITNLTKPDSKGEDIMEENEDVVMSKYREQLIKERIRWLEPKNKDMSFVEMK